jgi:hypothetical protein
MRAKTLAQLGAQVRKRADLGPPTTTGRHTDAELYEEIQASWQAMRAMVSHWGRTLYLKCETHAAGTMTTVPAYSELFGTVGVPLDAAAIFAVSVGISSTSVRDLTAYDFATRDSWSDAFGATSGCPVAYAVMNMGSVEVVGGAPTLSAGLIALFPCPNQSYPYNIWYLPVWRDVMAEYANYAIFDGVTGWEDWVIWHTVLKFCAADNDMQNCAAIAMQGLAQAEALLRETAQPQRAPIQRVDRRAMDRRAHR